MWVLFAAMTCVSFVQGVTCTVNSCDAFMQELADGFVCEGETQCESEIDRHLEAITPIDGEAEFVRRRKILFASFDLGCPLCTVESFTAWNDWARVPGSLFVANATFLAVTAREDNLVRNVCVVWVDPEQPHEQPQEQLPRECKEELPFLRWEVDHLYLRMFYILRRQAKYLSLLSAACTLQNDSSLCHLIISQRIAQMQQQLLEKVQSFPVSWQADDLRSQSCDSTFPCLAELESPALSATSIESTRAALRTALGDMAPSAERSNAYLVEIRKRSSVPAVSCGFELVAYRDVSSTLLCSAGLGQLRTLTFPVDAWKVVTLATVQNLQVDSYTCMYGCMLRYEAESFGAQALAKAGDVKMSLVRRVQALCDSGGELSFCVLFSHCVLFFSAPCLSATREVFLDVLRPRQFFKIAPSHFFSNIFLLVGISINSLLICASFCLFGLILYWRLVPFTFSFVALLCFLVLGFALDLIWFILLYRDHFANFPRQVIINTVGKLTIMMAFWVFVVLCWNWMMAFYVLTVGCEVTLRVEKIFKGLVVGFGVLLMMCAIGFGAAFLVYIGRFEPPPVIVSRAVDALSFWFDFSFFF